MQRIEVKTGMSLLNFDRIRDLHLYTNIPKVMRNYRMQKYPGSNEVAKLCFVLFSETSLRTICFDYLQ